MLESSDGLKGRSMVKNSSAVLKALLTAMTAGELPYVEVQWRAYSPETPINDPRDAELTFTQPGSSPIVLKWEDGLERIAEVLSGGISDRMLRRMTVVRKGEEFHAVVAS